MVLAAYIQPGPWHCCDFVVAGGDHPPLKALRRLVMGGAQGRASNSESLLFCIFGFLAGFPGGLRPLVCAPLLPAGFLLAGFLTGLAAAVDDAGLSASLRLIDPAMGQTVFYRTRYALQICIHCIVLCTCNLRCIMLYPDTLWVTKYPEVS